MKVCTAKAICYIYTSQNIYTSQMKGIHTCTTVVVIMKIIMIVALVYEYNTCHYCDRNSGAYYDR
jgi:hypothetical protein